MADHEDELATTRTDGFKVGEKKTVEEYQKLGQYSHGEARDGCLPAAVPPYTMLQGPQGTWNYLIFKLSLCIYFCVYRRNRC